MRGWLWSLLVAGCTYTPTPENLVTPAPPNPPGFSCETARQNIVALGGCGLDLGTFAADCENAQDVERRAGVTLPVGCLSAATSCEQAGACK